MKRIEELNLARVIAMLSVIMIHVTSTYINYKSRFMIFNMNPAFILNQTARFAVPLFILLSGTSLTLSGAVTDLKQFYKKRLVKIGIPYLFWCTIYFLYNNHSNLNTIDIRSFVKGIMLGEEAPHLYFIIIILQFYLLYPFLKQAVERQPWLSVLISFIVSYIIQSLFFFLKFNIDLIAGFIRPYLWLLFPTWVFYFVVGMAMSKQRLSKIQEFAAKNAFSILVITVFFSAFYVIESRVTGSLESIKSPLNLFTLLILLCSFSLWKVVGKYRVVQKVTVFLAKHSMTIYFEHVLVLYFFRRFFIFASGMSGMLFLYVVVVVAATLLAILVDSFVQILKRKVTARSIRLYSHTE